MGDGFGDGTGRWTSWGGDEAVVEVTDGIEAGGGCLKRDVLQKC